VIQTGTLLYSKLTIHITSTLYRDFRSPRSTPARRSAASPTPNASRLQQELETGALFQARSARRWPQDAHAFIVMRRKIFESWRDQRMAFSNDCRARSRSPMKLNGGYAIIRRKCNSRSKNAA